MRLFSYLVWHALACISFAANTKPRNYETHDYFTLHLESYVSPEQVASLLSLQFEGKVGELPDHYLFSAPRGSGNGAEDILQELKLRRRKRDLTGSALDAVLWSQKSKLKPRMEKRGIIPPRHAHIKAPEYYRNAGSEMAIAQRQEIARQLEIRDPIFEEQWHLFNAVQLGHDVNVTGVWIQGITGHNATVVVVDDGLDMYSNDLKDNYFAEGSYDFNDHTDEPRPKLRDDRHGTRCAGEIAAVRNNVCGVGVAYDSKIAGVRILGGQISDEDEAAAINYGFQKNQVYSCSWGPPDDGKSMDAPSTLIKRAMVNGVQNGRGGKGSLFVFAAGNGAAHDDNCNFDGYTNSIYSITVGAIDRKGMHPYYSEKCSAQLVVTYSSGSGDAIHTTDVGTDACYSQHGGTSAAAPLAAGIFALVLSIRPDLNWRDFQYLCVDTAVPVNPVEEWATTYIGKQYSHTYGYGKLDSYALIEAAKTMKSVKPQAWYNSPWQHVKHEIPQGDQGLISIFEVTTEALKATNLERLEHVTVTMNVEHTRRGDLSVDLISPHGIVSHLSTARMEDNRRVGYQDWTFMSVVHWGEPGIGNWTVILKDTKVNEFNGTFVDWKMTLWGECIDPSTQSLLPMPTEHDDDDHNVMTAMVSTITVALTSQTELPALPTDHPDRPVIDKPTITSAIKAPTAEPGQTSTSEAASSSTPDSFLPSYFPTFGVSKRTQIWIYGAVSVIALFCAALGIYFYVQRRKRARLNRAGYEFEMLDDHDATAALTGTARGQRTRRRAGELYDAFAGESDEEVFSDAEDDKLYRDEEPERPETQLSEKSRE